MSSNIERANADRSGARSPNDAEKAISSGNKEEPKLSRWFFPVLLFLLVPSLYAIGITYWEAWLQAHSLAAVAFPLNFDQAVFKGYEALVLLLMSWLLPYLPKVTAMLVALLIFWAAAVALIVLWGVIGASLLGLISLTFQKLRAFLMAHASVVRIVGKAYLIASAPFIAAGVVIYVFFLLIVPIAIGQYAGKQIGQKSLDEIQGRLKSGKFEVADQFVTLNDGGEPLLVVACGVYGCGIADKEGVRFVTWEQVTKIARRPGLEQKGP